MKCRIGGFAFAGWREVVLYFRTDWVTGDVNARRVFLGAAKSPKKKLIAKVSRERTNLLASSSFELVVLFSWSPSEWFCDVFHTAQMEN